jgi:hypothetical protein
LLNFQSAQNATKMVPLRPSRLPDSVVYLLSQTESVWRRYRDLFAEPNRQKFDADCTCPYSPYRTRGRSVHADVAGYDSHMAMMWHVFNGWLLVNWIATRVRFWANGMRTRGPIGGLHVSLIIWFIYGFVKFYGGVRGVRPPDLPHSPRLHPIARPLGHPLVLTTYM